MNVRPDAVVDPPVSAEDLSMYLSAWCVGECLLCGWGAPTGPYRGCQFYRLSPYVADPVALLRALERRGLA